jgi:hypothetical protein
MTSIKRLLATIAAFVLFAVVLAPAGFAGEDEEDGTDNGGAAGGAGTGAGGTVARTTDSSLVVPLALAGGGLVLLTFGAGSLRRPREEQ